MKTCPNCGRISNEKYCGDCGALMVEAYAEPVRETYYAEPQAPEVFVQEEVAPKRKGRKGAIARLVVAALVAIGTVVAVIASVPTAFADGFFAGLLGGVTVLSTGFLVGAIILGLSRWLGFILPKSFGWANRFWRSWHALTIFGLYLKGCAWVIILLFPVGVLTSLISSGCFALVALLMKGGMNFFTVIIYLAVSAGAMAVLVFLDVCKVKGQSPKTAAKQMCAAAKEKRSKKSVGSN